MSARFQSPTRRTEMVVPVAPVKAPELRTPKKSIRMETNQLAPTKGPALMPKTAASYVYESPVKGGQAFDPVCPFGPSKSLAPVHPRLSDEKRCNVMAVIRSVKNNSTAKAENHVPY